MGGRACVDGDFSTQKGTHKVSNNSTDERTKKKVGVSIAIRDLVGLKQKKKTKQQKVDAQSRTYLVFSRVIFYGMSQHDSGRYCSRGPTRVRVDVGASTFVESSITLCTMKDDDIERRDPVLGTCEPGE